MAKYRKKPVVIDAVQWDGTLPGTLAIEAALPTLQTRSLSRHMQSNTVGHWKIGTLEGGRVVSPGDWIITGVKGEHYPCRDDIFRLTYESAALDAIPETGEARDALLREARAMLFASALMGAGDLIDRIDAAMGDAPKANAMVCRKCGADRSRAPCGGNLPDCGFMGTAATEAKGGGRG